MHVFSQPFWVPKAGNNDCEYEDAFWPSDPLDYVAPCFRFAVADGATETSYSKIWADLLVKNFYENPNNDALVGNNLVNIQQLWSRIVYKRPLPWYAEEHVRRGAYASFAGIVLFDNMHCEDQQGKWKAIALGDSCVIQIRGEEVLVRFPLDNSALFTNRPHLLSSNPTQNNQVRDHLQIIEGTWQVNDAFYLMTDALACWFMKEIEEEQMPWRVLRDFGTHDEIKPFCEWIEKLRNDGAIRNDDVTLLRIDIT